jgi:hypothetical protein
MAARPTDLDEAIRSLYLGPLGEFIAGRQALAKRLRQAGDARAGEVKALGKPAMSAWAVNQLFAREGKTMTALVKAGERARASQRRAMAGGDRARLREALAAIRAETARLAARGVEVLTAADRPPGEAIVERLRTNLEALALDPASAAVAARGWLDQDLEAPGFEVLAALQLAASGARPAKATRAERAAPSAPSPPPPEGRKATVHRLDERRAAVSTRREREAQERRERERRERIEQLTAELARAEAEAIDKRRSAQRAAQAAEEAARDAAEVEKRAQEARRNAQAAKESAASAEAAVARAHEALERAEQA